MFFYLIILFVFISGQQLIQDVSFEQTSPLGVSTSWKAIENTDQSVLCSRGNEQLCPGVSEYSPGPFYGEWFAWFPGTAIYKNEEQLWTNIPYNENEGRFRLNFYLAMYSTGMDTSSLRFIADDQDVITFKSEDALKYKNYTLISREFYSEETFRDLKIVHVGDSNSHFNLTHYYVDNVTLTKRMPPKRKKNPISKEITKKAKKEPETMFCVSKYCINTKCLEDLQIRERVTLLKDTVYAGCFGDDCKYTVKLIPIANNDLKKDEKINNMKKEFEVAKVAGETGFGPKVYKTMTCKGKIMENGKGKFGTIGIIVMERFQFSLYDLFKSEPELEKNKKFLKDLKKRVKGAFFGLVDNKISHQDIHEGNILLNLNDDGSIEKLVVGDFGLTTEPNTATKAALREILKERFTFM